MSNRACLPDARLRACAAFRPLALCSHFPFRDTISRSKLATRFSDMSSSTSYLITGASRGLGLEYSRQLLASSPEIKIVATARNPATATELKKLQNANEGRVYILELDVTNGESLKVGLTLR